MSNLKDLNKPKAKYDPDNDKVLQSFIAKYEDRETNKDDEFDL